MATGLGASNIAPSDESAWSTYAIGHNENAQPIDEASSPYDGEDDSRQHFTTSPKHPAQPKSRRSNGQLRNGDLNGLNRANSSDRLNAYRDENSGPSAKASRERLRTTSSERPRVKRKTSKGISGLLEDGIPEGEEHSKWIHRDKLAAIESRELAEMGLRVRHSRSTSRARSARTNKSSMDAADGAQEPMPDIEDDGRISRNDKRLRTKSPAPGDEDFVEEYISPDAFAESVSQRDNLPRPGTSSGQSRLPVSRHTTPYESQSPTDSPQHARSGSRELHMQKQRLRSQSGTLLPDEASSPRDGSGKRLPPSSARKASTAGARKYSSDSSSPHRPTTSGRSRPGTRNGVPSNPVNRPEGDPPWINSMYKPDPRLPPDQQMLPTHARRMAQLQQDAQERQKDEAADGESEFVLMDSEGSGSDQPGAAENQSPTKGRKQPPLPQAQQEEHQALQQESPRKGNTNRDSGQWPLRTPTPTQQSQAHARDAQLAQNNGAWSHQRSGTTDSVNGHGGYNLMPAIQTVGEQEKAVEMQHARLSMRSGTSHHHAASGHGRHLSAEEWQANASQAPVHQPVHLDPRDDKAAKKKDGCLSCCTVM